MWRKTFPNAEVIVDSSDPKQVEHAEKRQLGIMSRFEINKDIKCDGLLVKQKSIYIPGKTVLPPLLVFRNPVYDKYCLYASQDIPFGSAVTAYGGNLAESGDVVYARECFRTTMQKKLEHVSDPSLETNLVMDGSKFRGEGLPALIFGGISLAEILDFGVLGQLMPFTKNSADKNCNLEFFFFTPKDGKLKSKLESIKLQYMSLEDFYLGQSWATHKMVACPTQPVPEGNLGVCALFVATKNIKACQALISTHKFSQHDQACDPYLLNHIFWKSAETGLPKCQSTVPILKIEPKCDINSYTKGFQTIHKYVSDLTFEDWEVLYINKFGVKKPRIAKPVVAQPKVLASKVELPSKLYTLTFVKPGKPVFGDDLVPLSDVCRMAEWNKIPKRLEMDTSDEGEPVEDADEHDFEMDAGGVHVYKSVPFTPSDGEMADEDDGEEEEEEDEGDEPYPLAKNNLDSEDEDEDEEI